MNLAFKIAWRNVWRHKSKSIVIGFILFLGSLLMTIGNSVITGMEKGFEKNIIQSFTGDLVIISEEEKNSSVLAGSQGKPIEIIDDYFEIEKKLENVEAIERTLPAAIGFVMVFSPNTDMGMTALIGVDINDYQEMFPNNLSLVEGKFLDKNEKGVVISTKSRKTAYDMMGFWLIPEGEKLIHENLSEDAKKELEKYGSIDTKDGLVFMGVSATNSTVDVKSKVKGIFKFNSLNQIWGDYSIIDINSFRESHGYLVGDSEDIILSDEDSKIFSSDSVEDMFSDNSMFDEDINSDSTITFDELKSATKRKTDIFEADSGIYNIIYVKLKDGYKREEAINKINTIFTENNLKAKAISWKDSIGLLGSMTSLIKISLTIFISFIFFVAIIVIMNTLSMTALERVTEIGMMRAVGAKKSFLRNMFLSETFILSFLFGGFGLIVGVIISYIVSSMNITTTNEFLQIVYGGDMLKPKVGLTDIFINIFELLVVTVLAVIYPIRVVGKIVPLDAVSRE